MTLKSCHPASVLSLVEGAQRAAHEQSGTVVVQNSSDHQFGAIFVERGRICWAAAARLRPRLLELLGGACTTPNASKALSQILRYCRDRRLPLGQTLMERGIVTAQKMRGLLLRHAAESIAELSGEERAELRWVPRGGRGFEPAFTFGPGEILAALGALYEPQASHRATLTLHALLQGHGAGIAFLGAPRAEDCLPLAAVGADPLGVETLLALATWAERTICVTRSLDGPHGFAVGHDAGFGAAAAWQEDDVVFAVVCQSALGIEELLSRWRSLQGETDHARRHSRAIPIGALAS